MLKIKYIVIAISVIIVSCSEFNLVNIYNKVTEPYRGVEYDTYIPVCDTNITVRVVDKNSWKPLKNVRIKLTLPSQDSICMITDSLGCTRFKFTQIQEGSYTVNALFSKNGEQISITENHYMYKKDNLPIIIYVTEKKLY